ncbi:MAG: hypothetical protein D3926_20840 [Desulfobacteraceae bacterium]|nr:MAG: hypothetical protein D3926_20840 [Desulfobacteraceae bacterium]
MLPQATLAHHINGRARIRITGLGRGAESFFERTQNKLTEKFKCCVTVYPTTRSMVIEAPDLDIDTVYQYAESEQLFTPAPARTPQKNVVASVATTYFNRFDQGLRTLTSNRLDVSSSVFMVLIIHACREILNGNLRTPSWFTALWFASTIYNRDFLNSGHDDGQHQDEGGHDG